MGWNSWDCYGPTVTEPEVKANADYMAENLKQHGWEYIVVEQYTLMNLWCIFRSPLMFGGDLPTNDEFTLSLLTNDEVLAVNQNSTKNKKLKNDNGHIVWTADVPETEDKYVAFYNINHSITFEPEVSLTELGISGNYTAKDLWSKAEKCEKKTFITFRLNLMPLNW